MPRWATARRASVTDLGRPDSLDDVGEAAHEHDVCLATDDPGAGEARQLVEVSVAWVGAHDVVGATGDGGLGLVGVTGEHRDRTTGEEPLHRGHGGEPDDSGTDDEHRLPVDRAAREEAVTGDRDGLVEAGAPVGDGVGDRVEHRGVGQDLLAPSAAEALGDTRANDRSLRIRLSRLRHDDVHPRVQLGQGGSMPRAGTGMQGSTATRVPSGCGQSGPASITCPAISWPSTNGNEPIATRVGDGPVLWAKRWRSLPQIPPVVTSMRAHAAPGQIGIGQVDERSREGGIGHVELNGAHLAA